MTQMEISRDDERPVDAGPPDFFAGDVSVQPVFGVNEYRNTSARRVMFGPRARTAWHTHPAGQTLVVMSGTGWVQEWGGRKQQINQGDVIWTPPGVKHWHGATPDGVMTHLAISAAVDGNVVDWLDHVTDSDYQA